MGVKDLWGLVSPTGELLPLTSLEGKAVAVDLSCWVVDSQALHLGHVARPHLRNLFFRTMALLNCGVLPVFVLEGDAPSLKWNTINARNQRNFHPGTASQGKSFGNLGKRSRFKSVLKECGDFLDMLGVPWVQAKGEAEATCAALNYYKMVEGVITQDSDVFLYGGQTVFRNFTANQTKATVEKFSMSLLEEHLQLTRGGLILLALLLGCDYFPNGVQGVGKDTAVRLLRIWYQKGVKDPVRRLQSWANNCGQFPQNVNLNSRKWKNGNDEELEAGVRDRLMATDGFPFSDIIKEFQQELHPLPLKVKWAQPQYTELVRWCILKLEWEANYAIEKISPVMTRWMVTHNRNLRQLSFIEFGLMPVNIVKRCVRRGVASCEIKWKVLNTKLPDGTLDELTTDEPLHLLQAALPALLQEFEDAKAAKKKATKGTRKQTKNKTEKLKSTKEKKTTSIKKAIKVQELPIEDEQEDIPTEDGREDSSEDDISFIIDRIIGIDLTGKNRVGITKPSSLEGKEEKRYNKCGPEIDDLDPSLEERLECEDRDEEDLVPPPIIQEKNRFHATTANSDDEDKENRPTSLLDRITKKIATKNITSNLKPEKSLGAFRTKVYQSGAESLFSDTSDCDVIKQAVNSNNQSCEESLISMNETSLPEIEDHQPSFDSDFQKMNDYSDKDSNLCSSESDHNNDQSFEEDYIETPMTNALADENKNDSAIPQENWTADEKSIITHKELSSDSSSLLSETSLCKNQVSKDMFEDTNENDVVPQFSLLDLNSPSLMPSENSTPYSKDCDISSKKILYTTPSCNDIQTKPFKPISSSFATPNNGEKVTGFDDTISPLEPLSAKSLNKLQGSQLKQGKFVRLPQGCNSTPIVDTPKGRSKDNSYGICFKLLDSFSYTESFNCDEAGENASNIHCKEMDNLSLSLQYNPAVVSGIENNREENFCNIVSLKDGEKNAQFTIGHKNQNSSPNKHPSPAPKTSFSKDHIEKEKLNPPIQKTKELVNSTFSPVITGLSLAERIRKKCKDKAIDKILDNL